MEDTGIYKYWSGEYIEELIPNPNPRSPYAGLRLTPIFIEDYVYPICTCRITSCVCPAYLRLCKLIEKQQTMLLYKRICKELNTYSIQTAYWKQKIWFANAGIYKGSGDTEYLALQNLLAMYHAHTEKEDKC